MTVFESSCVIILLTHTLVPAATPRSWTAAPHCGCPPPAATRRCPSWPAVSSCSCRGPTRGAGSSTAPCCPTTARAAPPPAPGWWWTSRRARRCRKYIRIGKNICVLRLSGAPAPGPQLGWVRGGGGGAHRAGGEGRQAEGRGWAGDLLLPHPGLVIDNTLLALSLH